jgi:hypothetical protein
MVEKIQINMILMIMIVCVVSQTFSIRVVLHDC